MTKSEFCQALATVEAYNLALGELLTAATSDHFVYTAEGARELYEKYHKGDDGACALSWMNEHYDSIAAIVRASSYLSEATHSIIEPLWSEARALIPEEGAGETK